MKTIARRAAAGMLVVLSIVALTGCRETETAGTPPPSQGPQVAVSGATVGQAAPDLTLTTLDGKTISLSALKGKPVLVNFWSSTCHFCLQEAPVVNELYTQYRAQGLEVLGVGLDDPGGLQGKAEQLKLTYPIGVNMEAGQRYGVSGIPHTFVIDRQGRIAASLVGARPKSELEAEVRKVL